MPTGRQARARNAARPCQGIDEDRRGADASTDRSRQPQPQPPSLPRTTALHPGWCYPDVGDGADDDSYDASPSMPPKDRYLVAGSPMDSLTTDLPPDAINRSATATR